MNNKKILQTNNTTNKSFSYAKGDTKLSFVLRTDVKQELKDFLECLEVAIKDVKLELDKKNGNS